MTYKEVNIKEIAEKLRNNQSPNNKIKSALIIGAGVSVTAGIPLASGFIEKIKELHCLRCEREKPSTYFEYMKLLTPKERKDLINDYIRKSKLNPAHLYIASLVRENYFDRILTTNFDTLLSKALAIENIFPGIYDFAISQLFKSEDTSEISIFHLHGQKDGYKLLHTEKEVNDIFENSKKLFEDTLKDRTIIVVGYSGTNDPVFKHLKATECFNECLYWVGYKDHEPSQNVIEGILGKDNYSYFIKNYDADKFFIDLVKELHTEPPHIINKPFSILREIVNGIAEFTIDEKKTDPTKEIKNWINETIEVYENKKPVDKLIEEDEAKYQEEDLTKLVRESWINQKTENYIILKKKVTINSSEEVKKYYSYFLNDWGVDLGDIAEKKKGKDAVNLFNEAFNKFSEAIQIEPNYFLALYNWGTYLGKLAKLKEWKEAEKLYKQAFRKFEESIKIKPNDYDTLYNWGTYLGNLAKMKKGKEAEKFYKESFEKYEEASKIKPDYYKILYNWGTDLGNLAQLKVGVEAEKLYKEAFEKFKKALTMKPDYYEALCNWGTDLGNLAKMKVGEEAEKLYKEAFKKYREALKIKPDDYETLCSFGIDLGNFAKMKEGEVAEKLYMEAFDNYKEVLKIKPDDHNILYSWGTYLSILAKLKDGEEAEKLYNEAFEKYREALKINPNNYNILYSWGTDLGKLAKMKEGEEAENYFKEALNILNKGEIIKEGSCLYNIACFQSILGEKEPAIENLIKSIKIGVAPLKDYIKSDKDLESIISDNRLKEYLN